MSESAFHKRFRSSYESLPSVSPPDLPSRKRYRGTSELVEDSREHDDEEDEEIEESMDSDSVSKDAEDEGPTAEDEDPAAEDEGHTAGVEGPESDRLGLEEEEEAKLGGQQQAAPVLGKTISTPLGLGYGALRRHELALEEGDAYNTFEVGQGSGSAPESDRPERVSAFRQPTLTTLTDQEDDMIYIDILDYLPPAPLVQTPPSPESLEYKQERVAMTFRAIWRPVLALEAWAGQTDAQRAAMWHAISDVQGENRDSRLQLAEERRARLELTQVVDGMRRG
ncbi:hypothetical protein Tco_1097619 [Tanacetum coccineum]